VTGPRTPKQGRQRVPGRGDVPPTRHSASTNQVRARAAGRRVSRDQPNAGQRQIRFWRATCHGCQDAHAMFRLSATIHASRPTYMVPPSTSAQGSGEIERAGSVDATDSEVVDCSGPTAPVAWLVDSVSWTSAC